MKNTALLALVSTLALASCNPVAPPTGPGPGGAAPIGQLVYGLTTAGKLVVFGMDNANASMTTMDITGLGNGETLVDLDVRNTDNSLYGFSSTGTAYRFNVQTGTATVTGAAVDDSTVALRGASVVAADFNPGANRLRVIGTSTLNFRHTVAATPVPATTGTTFDGNFAYAPTDANTGKTPNLVAAAYTGSFDDRGKVNSGIPTELYSIDAALDTLVFHPAAGAPQFNTLSTRGALGVDAMAGMTGFDIAGASAAYLSTGTASSTNMYTVDLTSGKATLKTTINGVSLKSFALRLATQ